MRISIQYKITFIFAVVVAAILASVFIYLHNNIKDQAFQSIKRELNKETRLSMRYLQTNMPARSDIRSIDAIADTIGESLGVRVTVIALDGKVLGDSELSVQQVRTIDNHLYRPEIQRALQSGMGEVRRFSRTVNQELLYHARIFTGSDNQPQGFIRLAVPLSDIRSFTDGLKRLILFSLGFAFVLALVFGWLATNLISRPIKSVSSVAKGISRGDFSERAGVYSNDELGDLSTSINHMSKQIKERIDEVTTSRLRLEAVLLSMFDGVIVVGADGKIVLMNQTLRELLQVTEEVVGKKPIEVIRNVEVQEIISQVMKKQKSVSSREISVLFPKKRELIIHAAPVVMKDTIDGVVMVFHDISDLKRLEAVRKDFVANVSHELRTPITNIKGYAETLLEGALTDKANAEDFTRIIYNESERLAKLVEDVLDLSKIESGKIKYDFQPQDIGLLVDRVEKGLRKQMQKKRITFRRDIPADFPPVQCDGPSIAQVLLNLMENALKYNNEGGYIAVSARVDADKAVIAVSDNGLGIPEEDIPRIFERFFRVDKAHSREIGGTGLGLSIVKHLIQSHQGEVQVTSQLGLGSTFSFSLPIASKNVT